MSVSYHVGKYVGMKFLSHMVTSQGTEKLLLKVAILLCIPIHDV